MSIERISMVGWLAVGLLATAEASGQDFNERLAAWQGRAPAPQRTPATSMPAPEIGGEGEDIPALGTPASQRVLSNVYSAPQHTPDYNRPWTTSGCASCGHNPTFVPPSDPFGTCNYAGGDGGFWGGGGCNSCGPGGCFGCGQCGGAGGGCDWSGYCSNPQVWARFDLLLWWRQGRDLPPLVTTDPTTESSTTAGILPDAQILFGGGRVGTNMQAGGRFDIGFFTDPRQCSGYGVRFFGLGKDSSEFNVSSNNVPVLAIPFHDFATGNNDALLVAYPGLRTGSINFAASSSVISNDIYGKYLLCCDGIHRIDFITGWNYTRVADDLTLRSRQTVTEIDGSIPVGTVTTTRDFFTARNEFNGGILGLQWQRNCGC